MGRDPDRERNKTMKTTKLSVSIDYVCDPTRVISALRAAFSPFGSLTEGVDGRALAQAMIHWVDTKDKEQRQLVNEIVDLVWAAETDQFSTVEVGRWEVSLRTPTSGTRIRLRRLTYTYHVEVDFGPNGSESRSMSILERAERNGVKFDAYDGEGRIERGNVLIALLDQAKKRLEWVEGLEPGYYSEERRAEVTARANEAIAFFESVTP